MKIVTFETAKLANELGFNFYCHKRYTKEGKLMDFVEGTPNMYAPTQDHLQHWLESQNRYLSIAPEFYPDGINWNFQVLWYLPKEEWLYDEHINDDNVLELLPREIVEGTGYFGDNGEYPTRYDAVEAALKMALMKLDPLYKNNSIDKLCKYYNTDVNGMVSLIRPFSKELGDWAFNNLTPEQLKIITTHLGIPESIYGRTSNLG